MPRLRFCLVPVLFLFLVAPSFGQTGSAEDALATCLADNTSGRDRKDLARWVFAAISRHPEIEANTKFTEEERARLDQRAAKLYERLLAEDCRNQAKAANSSDNSSIRKAFQTLGVIASQELMSDPKVQAGLQGMIRMMDHQKINQALK